MIKKIEEYVYKNPWDAPTYLSHVEAVRRYALNLASKLNADKTVVEIAALLHDVGKIKELENHHKASVEIAKKLLQKFDADKNLIDRVAHCIEVHRASREDKAETIEAQIIKDADGLAFIDLNTGTVFSFLFGRWTANKLSFKEGLLNTKIKVRRMHEKITTDYGKELAKPMYERLMSLFLFLGEQE